MYAKKTGLAQNARYTLVNAMKNAMPKKAAEIHLPEAVYSASNTPDAMEQVHVIASKTGKATTASITEVFVLLLADTTLPQRMEKLVAGDHQINSVMNALRIHLRMLDPAVHMPLTAVTVLQLANIPTSVCSIVIVRTTLQDRTAIYTLAHVLTSAKNALAQRPTTVYSVLITLTSNLTPITLYQLVHAYQTLITTAQQNNAFMTKAHALRCVTVAFLISVTTYHHVTVPHALLTPSETPMDIVNA